MPSKAEQDASSALLADPLDLEVSSSRNRFYILIKKAFMDELIARDH